MPTIIVTQAIKFAHLGYQVEEFEPHPEREPRETTQEVIDVLKGEGLFEVVDEGAAPPAVAADQAQADSTPAANSVTTKMPAKKAATKKA